MFYVFLSSLVAENFLNLESFTIFENTFHIWSPEKKKMRDVKWKSPEESLESGEEVEEECQTVEVHGVHSSEVARFIAGLMKTQRKGGGKIERESLNEKSGILTVQFQDKKSKMQLQDTVNSWVGVIYGMIYVAPLKKTLEHGCLSHLTLCRLTLTVKVYIG